MRRNIHELLITLRDTYKPGSYPGLCFIVTRLWLIDKISTNEYNILNTYIKENKPKRRPTDCSLKDWLNYYYWAKYSKSPRMHWLNKHIKLTASS